MARPGYVDRNRLRSWADTRISQSEFPRLLRRLVLETTPGLVELGMPAGEGVAAGGWDGSVRTSIGTAWVPEGLSVWELSVNASPNTKADDDYLKRVGTPDGTPTAECTYVEAILRPWIDRGKWSKSKQDEKVWRDVRALGIDDIETWLESAPVTWAWLSEELGLSPYGLRTGSTWWRTWAAQTDPEFRPDVVLAGRAEEARTVSGRIASSGSVTTVAGASTDEVCAFIAALAVDLDSRGEGQMLSRLVFVDDRTAWRQLAASPRPLVLVPCVSDLAAEIPPGTAHNFFVPVPSTEGADVEVQALDAAEVTAALLRAGIGDADKAEALGRLGRRSLTALRRNLAVRAVLHRPAWAEISPSRNLRSILLAGSWGHEVAGDRGVVEILAGVDYETFCEDVSGIADSPTDPLVIRTDGAWHLVSPVDAWMLLAAKLTHDDLNRLETVVQMVLAEGDPSLTLPHDQQWRASIDGKTRRYSSDLRRGLAQSLILLGMYGESLARAGGSSGLEFANYLVRKLLAWAAADPTGRAWQSLTDVLPLLAEAGPDAFLDAVAAASAGDTPLLATMFQDNTEEQGLFTGATPHTGLLWALECVSWSPDYFGRAVDVLARLDGIDPGGRMSNRPATSLASIFRPWHPDSSVDADRRIAVIDVLRKRHPDSAWKLECSMLPEGHGTHFPISSPRFQTWKPDKLSVTYGEVWKMTTAAVERCIQDAGEDEDRWSKILGHISAMAPADRSRVVNALTFLADQPDVAIAFRDRVWRTITDLIGHHRDYSDATWALSEDELIHLEELAARYQPKSAYVRLVGLFQSWTPHIGMTRLDNYEEFELELSNRRIDAVKQIEAEGGFDAILDLVRDESVPGSVGIAMANTGSSHDIDILDWIASEDHCVATNAMSYFSARYQLDGIALIMRLLTRDQLNAIQRARLLLVVRDDFENAWALAASDPETETLYWSEFQPLGLGTDFDKVDDVAVRLVRAGRHADALNLLSMYSRIEGEGGSRPSRVEVIVQALDGLLADQGQNANSRLADWDFQQLFACLEENREQLEPGDLARLEWQFLPVLGHGAKVPALSESLAANPETFVGVVCTVYRSRTGPDDDGTEDATTEEPVDPSLATNAYRLLDAWDTPPGLVDGLMDGGALHAWLDRATELLAERGRLEVGLQQIGQVLGHTPPDADGTWPGLVVRDLIEDRQLDHVETGLYLHIVNGRGVTSRGVEDGGDQERQLASDFRMKAEGVADVAPRLARLFRRVAGTYQRDARDHDADAERFRRGLH